MADHRDPRFQHLTFALWDNPESETLETFASLSEALAYLDKMGGDQ